MFPLDKGLQWVNVKQQPFRQISGHLDIIRHIEESDIFRCYPDIFYNCGISRTLTYSEPEAYSEPWYIQNPAIFRTLAYSKFVAYSEPCRTS